MKYFKTIEKHFYECYNAIEKHFHECYNKEKLKYFARCYYDKEVASRLLCRNS